MKATATNAGEETTAGFSEPLWRITNVAGTRTFVSVPPDPVEVGRPATPPVEPAVDEPLTAPVDEPLAAPVDEPLAAPADDPLAAPADEPLAAPADEPVAAPADEPVAAGAEPACACALVRLDVVVVVCLELPHAASVIDSTAGKSFQGLTISA